MIYLGSAQASIDRIKLRVSKGGHFVPDEDVKRRYIRSLCNFWNVYRLIVSEWRLHYNGKIDLICLAAGSGEKVEVYNDMAFGWVENIVRGAQT
jgi:predicted ABC-type ATPase